MLYFHCKYLQCIIGKGGTQTEMTSHFTTPWGTRICIDSFQNPNRPLIRLWRRGYKQHFKCLSENLEKCQFTTYWCFVQTEVQLLYNLQRGILLRWKGRTWWIFQYESSFFLEKRVTKTSFSFLHSMTQL